MGDATLQERLRAAGKPGIGAASDWSDAECIGYWSAIAIVGRRLHNEAAAALDARDAEIARIIEQCAAIAEFFPAPGDSEQIALSKTNHGERIATAIRALAKGGE